MAAPLRLTACITAPLRLTAFARVLLPGCRAMGEGLREHLDALPGTWRVFVDADGDLELSVTTK